MTIESAQKSQSRAIARLIMTAMTAECCLYFVGKGQTLADFERVMTLLVEREDSQYSYKNTLVALHQQEVVGVCVAYDGAKLHALRQAFIDMARRYFNRDFANMDDETQKGELYVDSLAVVPAHRGQGIAQQLLLATIEKAKQMKLEHVGLLVDKGNPKAEKLYTKVGFTYRNEAQWGGHPMKHLQYDCLPNEPA